MSCSYLIFTLLCWFCVYGNAAKIKDPHGIFCGSDNCYDLLKVEREATRDEIRRSYRALSLQNHPDKNLEDEKRSKEKFSKIATAYEVLLNSTKREEFNFHLDHPDAYWIKYGSHVVFKYAPESDIRLVILGLLLVISGIGYGLKFSHYLRYKSFVTAAAEANLGISKGGTRLSLAIREEAESILQKRLADRKLTKSDSDSKKIPKKTKKEKADEEFEELKVIIKEVVNRTEIKGKHRKPNVKDIVIVKLAIYPYCIARYLYFTTRWILKCKIGKMSRLPVADETYWTIRAVGKYNWDEASESAKKEALETATWQNDEALEHWQIKHVENFRSKKVSSSKNKK